MEERKNERKKRRKRKKGTKPQHQQYLHNLFLCSYGRPAIFIPYKRRPLVPEGLCFDALRKMLLCLLSSAHVS